VALVEIGIAARPASPHLYSIIRDNASLDLGGAKSSSAVTHAKNEVPTDVLGKASSYKGGSQTFRRAICRSLDLSSNLVEHVLLFVRFDCSKMDQ
jgi:hypothetical protein